MRLGIMTRRRLRTDLKDDWVGNMFLGGLKTISREKLED
jgi:hypothetical protein